MPPGFAGLGPHVVGRRVVVRRRVPGETGPTGGPALTDLVGILETWDDDALTVRTDTGSVRVARALVVAGKAVPERAVDPGRVGVAETEALVPSLWPRLEVAPLGAWSLRSDPAPVGRLRKRANSALAVGDPGLPLDDALERVRSFYATRGREVIVQAEAGGDLDRALAERGWAVVPGGEAHLLMGPVHRALKVASRGAGPGPVRVEPDGVLALATSEAGSAEAALADGWLGVHDLQVDQQHRRRGWARALMGALLGWGQEQGAGTLWLHVEVGNAPALALYEALGLRRHHTMRYRIPVPRD